VVESERLGCPTDFFAENLALRAGGITEPSADQRNENMKRHCPILERRYKNAADARLLKERAILA
jgi:hypothetical protein